MPVAPAVALVALLALTACGPGPRTARGPASARTSMTRLCPTADSLVAVAVATPPPPGYQVTEISDIHCSGTWAVAVVDVRPAPTGDYAFDEPVGYTVAQIFRLRAREWTVTDRRAACTGGGIPATLHEQACMGG